MPIRQSASPLQGADQRCFLVGGGEGGELQMLAIAYQVVLDVVIADADLGGLVAFAHHMKPPVAHAIAADVAHSGRPVVTPDQIGDAQVHGEQGRDDEQRAFVCRVGRGHLLGSLDHEAPLQLGQRARGNIESIALLVDGFLFYRPEGVHLGEPLIDGVLEEAATDCEYLSHRSLGHAVGTGGKGSDGLFGNLAFALGHGVTERSPLQIDDVGVRVELLATTHAQEAGLYDRTDPVGGRVEAELHEGLGVPATQFNKGLASHQ